MCGKITNKYVLLENFKRKMVVERDIVEISVPYLAGIAAVAVIHPEGSTLYILASSGLAAAILGILGICGKGEGRAAASATYIFLGIFTACCSEAGAAFCREPPLAARNALQWLKSVILDAGFSDSGTEALVTALLTGDRSGLDGKTIEAFRTAGAAHILALSGLHLGIIYGILKRLFFWTGKSRPAEMCTSLGAVAAAGFYVLMTGCGASVVRAFLFICLNELARLCPGRRRRPLAVYATALIVQLTADATVLSSPGFQLSYMAMLGIYLLFPVMDSWYPGSAHGLTRRIWRAAALTISCQVFTAPLVWWHFRSFPTYFLLTNLIALPLTEALILCAVATITTTAAGLCPPPLIHLTDFLAGTLSGFLEAVASIS